MIEQVDYVPFLSLFCLTFLRLLDLGSCFNKLPATVTNFPLLQTNVPVPLSFV